MTQFDRLKELFQEFGIIAGEPGPFEKLAGFSYPLGTAQCIRIGRGLGYFGFATDFYFDEKGAFLGHAVFE